MTSRKVIVFGPTGAVGSSTARTAAGLGAKVVLAMRDTSKPVPELDAEQEKQGGFERVRADLTQADTVRNAVTATGAKHAFIYHAHGTPDHMRSTVEALKAGGIELVVFLSSFTIHQKLEDIQPSEAIPYIHAQVELVLRDVFGPTGFVAARPGSFASNTVQYKSGMTKGDAKVFGPDVNVDNIVPEDIGRVCGTVLANGVPQDGNRAIYIYGPKLYTQTQAVETLVKELGLDAKVSVGNKEDAYKMFVEDRKVPEPIAKYMVDRSVISDAGKMRVFGYDITEEELSHVQKYTGKPATTFEQWIQKNKEMFLS